MIDKIIYILNGDKPYDVFKELFDNGELETLLPELYNLHTTTEAGHKNNFFHTLGVLKNVCDMGGDLNMKLVAVFHDIGKPITKRKKEGGWTFHNHELIGAKLTMKVFDRWGVTDVKFRDHIYRMIEHHGRLKIQRDVTESAIRRLDVTVGSDIMFDLLDFCKCDITTSYDEKRKRIQSGLDAIRERIVEIREKDEDAKWRSPITGHVIMELLNTTEGRLIGEIKRFVDPKIKSGEWTEQDGLDYINNKYKQ